MLCNVHSLEYIVVCDVPHFNFNGRIPIADRESVQLNKATEVRNKCNNKNSVDL